MDSNFDTRNTFTDTGVNDIGVGVALYQAIGVKPYDNKDPNFLEKMRYITDYLNQHPDPHYIIGKIRNNKSPNMSNIDFIHSYVMLVRKKDDMENELKKISKEIEYYG